MRIGSGGRLILMVASSIVITIILMMTFVETPAEKSSPIFGEPALKEAQRIPTTENTSSYHSIKDKKKKVEKGNLRYKERKSEENPFFSLYKEKQYQPVEAENNSLKNPKEKTGKKKEKEVKEEGFFNVANSDLKEERHFFEAVFREKQHVQEGKALKIFLKEAISELHLEEGTMLKGVPYLEGGSRLKIKITAAIVDDKIRPVELRCFDKEDCMEGLYHDDIAEQLEGDTKNRLLEEVFDLGIDEEIIKRGKRVVQNLSDIIKSSKKGIVIERGRELFVAVHKQTE